MSKHIKEDPDKFPKTFIVLGMHRSATSLVAKGLATQINMGATKAYRDAGNPEGYWEDKAFIDLNTRILKQAQTGSSWYNPPPEENILSRARFFKNHISKLIEDKNGVKLWGWKDPRTTLTIRLFMPYIKNPHIIPVFRDREEVAKSLATRDGFTHEFARDLADEYNKRLLSFMADFAAGKWSKDGPKI